MLNFVARARGTASSALSADLRRITDNDYADVPKDAINYVVSCANTLENRKEIMQHLQACLADTSRWRRVHGALLLVEPLFVDSNKELLTETAEGKHFDVVQRLTFLERFDHPKDARVQNMVRTKAGALRTKVLRLMESAEGTEMEANSSSSRPLERNHHDSQAAASGPARRPEKKDWEFKRRNVMADDTDSDADEAPSSKKGPEYSSSPQPAVASAAAPAPASQTQARKPAKVDWSKKRDVMADDTDSEDDRPAPSKQTGKKSDVQNGHAQPAAGADAKNGQAAAAPIMADLLDMDFSKPSNAGAAATTSGAPSATPEVNLLDM
mmetsp:Transcript_34896/g.81614  ORF Transcript_34896/g.81614 Transcript_34896/m.81614 type:complete len:325 (+) Transcript_34896:65-1039(+)